MAICRQGTGGCQAKAGRRGFTLVELLVVIAIIGVLVAPAAAGHSGCPRGRPPLELHEQHEAVRAGTQLVPDRALKTFPPGTCVQDAGNLVSSYYASCHAMLLPYFEEASLKNLYDSKIDWKNQTQLSNGVPGKCPIPATVIPVFACPSCGGENPNEDIALNTIFIVAVNGSYLMGQQFGVTNYAVCKGVTDAWCLGPSNSPPGPDWVGSSVRGMFDVNWAVPIRKITDGTTNTIAMGEAAHGPNWPLANATANGQMGDLIWSNDGTLTDQRTALFNGTGQSNYGQQVIAWAAWIAPQPCPLDIQMAAGSGFAGIYGCTLEPMNKTPVTQTAVERTAAVSNKKAGCRMSQMGATGHQGSELGRWQPLDLQLPQRSLGRRKFLDGRRLGSLHQPGYQHAGLSAVVEHGWWGNSRDSSVTQALGSMIRVAT